MGYSQAGKMCLLSVIYINDIDKFIVSHILKFADDTKIYHVVNSSTAIVRSVCF